MPRVAVVNTHPIQYFAPLYAYINRSSDIELVALYCSDASLRGEVDPGFNRPVTWDIDLLGGYPSKFMGKRASRRSPRGFWSLIVPELWAEIRSGEYDALWLHGHNFAATWVALLAARSKRIPVMMRCETHLILKRGRFKRALRPYILRLLYAQCSALLAIGSRNKAFYRSVGVPEEKIFLVPYSIDNDRFKRASTLEPESRAAIRQRYGIADDKIIVLYASKLSPRKHPDQFVRAVSRLSAEGLPVVGLVIGSGEMETQLREMARQMPCIRFGGFANQMELPEILGASDVFVLPAEDEPWGLAVNEAMSAGLPVVVGAEMGCVADLVVEGVTGFTCLPGEDDSLVAPLRRLVADHALRCAMSMKIEVRISSWGFPSALSGLREALRTSVANASSAV